jgi:DNA-binding GntR family transcriptional regulator
LAALSAEWSTEILAEMCERFGPAAALDGHIMAARDEAFHEQLAAATGNRLLFEQLQGINERLHFLRAMDITTRERLAATCAEHGAILDAVSRRDSEGARLALRRNVQQGRDQVEAALRSAVARAYVRDK